jgi:hypothetical protein
MNREHLAELITVILSRSGLSVDALLDALWPVLAQVWDDGYNEGRDDGAYESIDITPNPYGEPPDPEPEPAPVRQMAVHEWVRPDGVVLVQHICPVDYSPSVMLDLTDVAEVIHRVRYNDDMEWKTLATLYFGKPVDSPRR